MASLDQTTQCLLWVKADIEGADDDANSLKRLAPQVGFGTAGAERSEDALPEKAWVPTRL